MMICDIATNVDIALLHDVVNSEAVAVVTRTNVTSRDGAWTTH